MNSIVNSLVVHMHKPVFIFILSIAFCVVLLMVERMVGIGWDYHPDAKYYLKTVETVATVVTTDSNHNPLFSLFFKSFLYQEIVDILGNNLAYAIIFNVILYAITNVGLVTFYYKNKVSKNNNILLLLFILVVLNPYRTHLAVHVLKDTLIVFSLVFVALGSRVVSLTSLAVLYFTSIRSLVYLVAFFSFTKRSTLLLSIFSIAALSIKPEIFTTLLDLGQVNMNFREYDLIPNFINYESLGPFMRFIIWPFFSLTGLFAVFNPYSLFMPVAFGSFALQYWCFKQYGRFAFYFPVYVSMGLMAFMVSGFTSYTRYTLPLLTILPILIVKKQLKNE